MHILVRSLFFATQQKSRQAFVAVLEPSACERRGFEMNIRERKLSRNFLQSIMFRTLGLEGIPAAKRVGNSSECVLDQQARAGDISRDASGAWDNRHEICLEGYLQVPG